MWVHGRLEALLVNLEDLDLRFERGRRHAEPSCRSERPGHPTLALAEGRCIAELSRIKGEIVLQTGAPKTAAAAGRLFRQSIDVARRQGALSWELRAAMSLARLWRGQQRVSQARKLLAPVYRRFTEGFGTADLIAAKSLLASLR